MIQLQTMYLQKKMLMHFSLNMMMKDLEDLHHLKKVSEDKKVVLGLITTKKPDLEDKEKVINRIRQAAKYIPLERLCLSPQCGFASCAIGNKLTEEEQWAKLKLVKEIAEEVWKTHKTIHTEVSNSRFINIAAREKKESQKITLIRGFLRSLPHFSKQPYLFRCKDFFRPGSSSFRFQEKRQHSSDCP